MSEIKERPMLYSAPMVRAKLREIDPKTQTRRLVKPPKMAARGSDGKRVGDMLFDLSRATADKGYLHVPYAHPIDGWEADPKDDMRWRVFPRWEVGDRLWGREAIGHTVGARGKCVLVYRADNFARWLLAEDGGEGDLCGVGEVCKVFEPPTMWKPSIHMPRWASRILDEIVEIRVERVQDISEADAIAEGAERNANHLEEWNPDDGYRTLCVHYPDGCECFPHMTARDWYAELWDHINGKGSWESNPWVWVIVTKPIQLETSK